MRIETGTFSADFDTPGWGLSQGEGQRSFDAPISFSQGFNAAPRVIIGLTHLDGRGSSLRVDTQAVGVNSNGFTVRFATWLDSLLYGAGVNWLACGD